ncbi:MAG TPA: hypothetical protein VMU95_00115 [Trebonia sp.]|nr:hypothetical protein [Trebonia sp.]
MALSLRTDLSCLATYADDSLTFDVAAQILDVAREQFAADYERHGERVAVYRFKQQVSHWSNQFAPELQGTARTIGGRVDGQTHKFQIAWSRLLHWHEQGQGEMIALNTMRKRARIWAGADGLEIIENNPYSPEGNGGRLRSHAPAKDDPDRLGRDKKRVGRRGGKQMNGWDSHTFRVDFSKVIKGRRVYDDQTRKWHVEYYAEPWDFRQIGPDTRPFEAQSPDSDAEESLLAPSIPPQLPLDSPSVTPYGSSPGSPHGSPHGSLTVQAGDGQSQGEEPHQGEIEIATNPSLFNTYVVRTYASGKQAYARYDRRPGLSSKKVTGEKLIRLTPDEESWLWYIWPAKSPEPPETRAARISYLLATEDERAALIEQHEAQEEAAREEHECEEAERAAKAAQEREEHAARVRAEREAAQAEFDRLVPEFMSLASRYDTTSPDKPATYVDQMRRESRDPHQRVAKIRKEIEWYRQALAEREQRAPLAERALEYVSAHEGAGEREIADALGAEQQGFWEVLLDLQDTGRVRRTWAGKQGALYWLPE